MPTELLAVALVSELKWGALMLILLVVGVALQHGTGVHNPNARSGCNEVELRKVRRTAHQQPCKQTHREQLFQPTLQTAVI